MAERRGIKALELWCRRMTDGYPGVKIDNMTTSWRDGLAFCAMIHHFRPELIEFDKLNKADVYYNNELAFTTAEKYLGIPALLDADDMAAHEVPDRLSILTYLSQFYQAFAAQDSPNRLKRPSPAGEKSPLTKTAGPPPKMAHVVGVPRRDPCQKCQLPVFLAERLTVGKKVFHRTCLKCARCSSQLTPGSFYETEVDNEYCCETCPDEEIAAESAPSSSSGGVVLRNANSIDEPAAVGSINDDHADVGAATAAQAKPMRSSIAARLAFFEHAKDGEAAAATAAPVTITAAGSKLLQKSVTDEEKTNSLRRMEATAAASTPYQMSSALSSFLSDTIDVGDATAEAEGESEPSTSTEDKTDTQMETSDSDGETEHDFSAEAAVPPALPTTPAPEVEMRGLETKPALVPASKRFTATAQLQLITTAAVTSEPEERVAAATGITQQVVPTVAARDAEDNVATPEKKKTEIQLQLATTATPTAATSMDKEATSDTTNNNGQQPVEATVALATTEAPTQIEESQKLTQTSLEINLELSATNDNDCVTKDKIADTDIMDTDTVTVEAAAVATAPSAADGTEQTVEQQVAQQVLVEQPPMLVNETDVASTIELRTKSLTTQQQQQQPEDAATTERLSVVRARLQQFEVIANKHNNNDNDNDKDKANDKDKDKAMDKDNDKDKDNTTANVASADKISLSVSNAHSPSSTEPHENSMHADSTTLTTQPKSMPHENLEDEVKLKAMEIDTPQPMAAAEPVASVAAEPMEESNVEISNLSSKVPTQMETKDNEEGVATYKPETEMETIAEVAEETPAAVDTTAAASVIVAEPQQADKPKIEVYPEDLNPFKSDEEDDDALKTAEKNKENLHTATPRPRVLNSTINSSSAASSRKQSAEKLQSSNPFDSSDDEIELEKSQHSSAATTPSGRVPPPRPPPPRISRNPFGEDTDEDGSLNFSRRSSLSSSLTKKTPVPTPRTNISQSQNPTPEPTPRLSSKTPQHVLQESSDYYGSANSLSATPASLQRNSDTRGSNNSLTSSGGGTIRSRRSRKAPAPPPPVKELFPSSETVNSGSKGSTPSSSTVGSPKTGRKKRPAPAPPKPARLDPGLVPHIALEHADNNNPAVPKNLHSYPLQSDLDSKLSDEEKALLEGKQLLRDASGRYDVQGQEISVSQRGSRRLIPLDASLLEEHGALDPGQRRLSDADGGGDGDDEDDTGGKCDDAKHKQQRLYNQQLREEETHVVYRRMLIPPTIETPTHDRSLLDDDNESHDRQLEKLKDNKEAKNRNRQSQISAASSGAEDDLAAIYNKSAHGKWKRRKGPAPALPIPPRKVLQMLPLQEIRHELEIIEVQQQGLEKQGVILEKMIRDRCEGDNGEPLSVGAGGGAARPDAVDGGGDGSNKAVVAAEHVQNSKEVEDLILQLFELVNEKNELFRRQAELMYLRRQHRLEQEQADLEYEIRVLMAQPERNKTDTDKAREEALIARLIEVVQLRNEVIECLEMDRLREAEEDLSIKQRLELHTAKREGELDGKKTLSKLSKKEKKKQKEAKKLSKSKKLDADKDADESELQAEKAKTKTKKKKFLF